jgi:hypothetical protein
MYVGVGRGRVRRAEQQLEVSFTAGGFLCSPGWLRLPYPWVAEQSIRTGHVTCPSLLVNSTLHYDHITSSPPLLHHPAKGQIVGFFAIFPHLSPSQRLTFDGDVHRDFPSLLGTPLACSCLAAPSQSPVRQSPPKARSLSLADCPTLRQHHPPTLTSLLDTNTTHRSHTLPPLPPRHFHTPAGTPEKTQHHY